MYHVPRSFPSFRSGCINIYKYGSTKVRRYEVRTFEGTFVLSYESTFVVRTTNYEGILSSKVRKYFRTFVRRYPR